MTEYHKIHSPWKRDNKGKFIESEWSRPEFAALQNIEWLLQEKIDGMNIRLIWDGETLKVRGRTDNAQIPTFLLESIEEMGLRERLPTVFEELRGEVVLYGEGYGNKIQKVGSRYIPDGTSFALFDVYFPSSNLYLDRDGVTGISLKLEIPEPHYFENRYTLREAVDVVKSKPKSWFADEMHLEGVILRPLCELNDRRGQRIITKLKVRDFDKE